jgi:hypothetical protein
MKILCKKHPNSLEPKKSIECSISSPSTPLPSYLTHQKSSHRTLPLQLIPGGDRTHVPFRVSELKEIKKGFRKLHRKPRSEHPGI